jgi:hypothetical protein
MSEARFVDLPLLPDHWAVSGANNTQRRQVGDSTAVVGNFLRKG